MPLAVDGRPSQNDAPLGRELVAADQCADAFVGCLAGLDNEASVLKAVHADGRTFAASNAPGEFDGLPIAMTGLERNGPGHGERQRRAAAQTGVGLRTLLDFERVRTLLIDTQSRNERPGKSEPPGPASPTSG